MARGKRWGRSCTGGPCPKASSQACTGRPSTPAHPPTSETSPGYSGGVRLRLAPPLLLPPAEPCLALLAPPPLPAPLLLPGGALLVLPLLAPAEEGGAEEDPAEVPGDRGPVGDEVPPVPAPAAAAAAAAAIAAASSLLGSVNSTFTRLATAPSTTISSVAFCAGRAPARRCSCTGLSGLGVRRRPPLMDSLVPEPITCCEHVIEGPGNLLS